MSQSRLVVFLFPGQESWSGRENLRGVVQPVATCYGADLRVTWAVRWFKVAAGVFVMRPELFFIVLKKILVKQYLNCVHTVNTS